MDSVSHLASIASELVIFVQWMVLHKIHYFRHVTPEEVRAYVLAREQGLDVCLNATPRLAATLTALSNSSDMTARRSMTCHELIQAAYLPTQYLSKLPACVDLLEVFKQTGCVDVASKSRPKKLCRTSIHRSAQCIDRLWQYHHKLQDGLKAPPFPNGVWATTSDLGSPSSHTPSMPIEVAAKLLQQSISWVLHTGPELLALRENMAVTASEKGAKVGAQRRAAIAEFNNTGSGRMWPAPLKGKVTQGQPGITLRTAADCFVPTAAWIVIAGFSARRATELMTLTPASLRGSPESGRWISTYIGKTLRRVDDTPCPEIVAKAVEILIRWGRFEPNSNFKIFAAHSRTKGRRNLFRVELHLDNFASFVGAANYNINGETLQWHSNPHQFRRIFVIIYVWRYDAPCLEALSYHLRHANLHQTLHYARDTELVRLMSEETQKLTLHKLRAIAQGEVRPAGILGKRLEKVIARMRKTVDVASSPRLEIKLTEWANQRGLLLKATPWGFCGARPVAPELRRSACQAPGRKNTRLDEDGRPAPTASVEEICASCWFHLTDTTRIPHWKHEIAKLEDSIRVDGVSDIMRNALTKRLTTLQAFVRKAFPEA